MPPQNDAPYMGQSTAGPNLKTALDRLVEEHITGLGTSILARVVSVRPGDDFTGTVDVHPMIHQQDALTRPYPHGPIHNVPYMRLQGGASAIIIDPQPGDIGFIIVAGRDMTHAITTRRPAPPASFRKFAMQDCVYVGGFLNDTPTQYIQARSTDQGWKIVTPGTVSIEASRIRANCDIETTGDIKAGGISLGLHTHGGVRPGGDKTGIPE